MLRAHWRQTPCAPWDGMARAPSVCGVSPVISTPLHLFGVFVEWLKNKLGPEQLVD